jgi:hypothetical protein
MRAFLSVGRVATPEQKAFLERLEAKLRNRDIEPRTIGRNSFTAGQPLEKIKEEMRQCRGLIALAFERTRFPPGGREFRLPPQAELELPEERYATPWHHIEIAIATFLGLPIFVVVQNGIREEGLLEDKYGWYVYRTQLTIDDLETDEFNGILDDWCSRAKSTARPRIDASDLSIGQLLSSLKVTQLWALLGTAITIAAALVTFGAWGSSIGLPIVKNLGTGSSQSSGATKSASEAGSDTELLRQFLMPDGKTMSHDHVSALRGELYKLKLADEDVITFIYAAKYADDRATVVKNLNLKK